MSFRAICNITHHPKYSVSSAFAIDQSLTEAMSPVQHIVHRRGSTKMQALEA